MAFHKKEEFTQRAGPGGVRKSPQPPGPYCYFKSAGAKERVYLWTDRGGVAAGTKYGFATPERTEKRWFN